MVERLARPRQFETTAGRARRARATHLVTIVAEPARQQPTQMTVARRIRGHTERVREGHVLRGTTMLINHGV